jgi:hypothetical protein|tara:strand:- start:81 stop:707 length:627 start_codon:yes stop_codon:yes gene_type:complete
MHNAAKMFLGIGAVGLIISVAVFGFSANQLTQIEDDMDIYWGDWIVYQGGNGDIHLDNEIGYTVYVDKSYDCSVSVSARHRGEEHYEAYCDSYYDFDEWMQLGDIYPSTTGYYYIEVEAEEFVLVDWTTPMELDLDGIENSLLGFFGCCLSLGFLMLGMILALVLNEKPEVMINQAYSGDSPSAISNGKGSQPESSNQNDVGWWNEQR